MFGKGSKFSWDGHDVADLTSIGTPEMTVDMDDVTKHNTTSRFKEWATKLIDAGEVPISGFANLEDSTGQQQMYTDCRAGTGKTAVITSPDGSFSLSFSALVSKIKPIGDIPVDGQITFSASVKVTGDVELLINGATGMTALTISNSGVITPVFASGTYSYVVTFLTGVASFTLTPTAAGQTIEITANGTTQTVTSGAASAAIALGAAGSITEVKVKVSETGKVAKTYTFQAVRAA